MIAGGQGNIEDLTPDDMIRVQPDDDQGDDEPHVHDDHAHNELRWWERN